MKARWSLAGLALATMVWAPAWAAQEAAETPKQKVTLSISNAQ